MSIRAFACGLAMLTLPLLAQEPKAARILPSSFRPPDGIVQLSLPWRYAAGDDPQRALPQFDDSRWQTRAPQMKTTDLRAGDWSGAGWFRRHLVIDPILQSRPLALRIAAPGLADVYLDGKLVLSASRGPAPPEVPAARSEAVLVRLEGAKHVFAVRYVYPRTSSIPEGGIGFDLALARDPATGTPPSRTWLIGIKGALVGLPAVLALLHFTLFAFDRRARENLFYALEMLALAAVVLHEYRDVLMPLTWQRELLERNANSLPLFAIFFGLLTYYALRTNPWPRTWRFFTLAAALLVVASSLSTGRWTSWYWITFFALVVVEIARVEVSGRVVARSGTAFHLTSFCLLAVAILLQILVNFEVIESVAGIHEVYIFGILASAVGMSLFLARTLGRSRIVEAENARKTHELAAARDLQLSMLPRSMPELAGLQVAAATQTAAEVGGDYYDVRTTEDGALLLAFGDATGHGLSAGIVVTAAKALFTSMPANGALPELLANCDRAMYGMQLPSLRMCLTLARISARDIALTAAAMPPALIHRAATGDVAELGAGGLPLGTRVRGHYEEQSSPLGQGDTLLFASDGFAELTDATGRQFGYDGVLDAFRRAAGASDPAEVIERLFAEAARFRGTQAQDDDITFVVVRVG